MSRVIVSGSLAYDRIMDFDGLFSDHILPEKIHNINVSFLINNLSVQIGGTAGNIAYGLALLGEQPEIIGNGGNDFDAYIKHLSKAGIDHSTIPILEDVVTSSAFIFTDKNDNQIAGFYPGAGGHAYSKKIETKGRSMAIVSPGFADDMIALPQMYREKGVKYIFDPGQQIPALSGDALRSCITGAAVVMCNDYELSMICQKTGWSESDIMSHAEVLVVTLGEKGSRVVSKDCEKMIQAAIKTQVIDPTGAGDAYRAGFIKGLLANMPLEQCAKLGGVVATYVIETYGTQNHTFTMDELKEKYKKSYGEILTI